MSVNRLNGMISNKDFNIVQLINDLWKKNRAIVSDGFDESLDYIKNILPISIHKFKSGSHCWTWTIPRKWILKEAFVSDDIGNKIIDIKEHPLHVVIGSTPVDRDVSKEELLQHLYYDSKRPDVIPYVYKYYNLDWGFCIRHRQLNDFNKSKYHVHIDSAYEEGYLKIGEFVVKGRSDKNIVVMAHLDHPGQAEDDLSGVVAVIKTAFSLMKRNNFYTYRFLFLSETIGSIAYLSHNENLIPKIKYAVFLEMLGNKHNDLTLQRTLKGSEEINSIARYVMKNKLRHFNELEFFNAVPNDEQVFSSPGVDIASISISRANSRDAQYFFPEYHSSADCPNIISEKRINEAVDIVTEILLIIDRDYIPIREYKGIIFLSRYGLFVDPRQNYPLHKAIDKLMLLIDGKSSIFDIMQKLSLDYDSTYDFIEKLRGKKLISICREKK